MTMNTWNICSFFDDCCFLVYAVFKYYIMFTLLFRLHFICDDFEVVQ